MPRAGEHRSPAEKQYHAEKERERRHRRKGETDAALVAFGAAATTLLRNGYTVGRLVDLLTELKEDK